MLHLAAEKLFGNELRHRRCPLIGGGPGLAVVVRAEEPGHGDAGIDPARLTLGEDDGVHAESTATRPPFRTGRVGVETGYILPGLTAVIGTQQRRGHDPCPDPPILVGAAGTNMPDPLAGGKFAASLPGLTLVVRSEDSRLAVPRIGRRPECAATIADHVADVVPDQ
jgi:hypothetical protein